MTIANGGDLLAATLADAGVDVAFGLHGGHLDSFLVGCESHGIKLIDTRHEAVAVNAADGYSRVAGRLGVAFATASSGFSNALAGLAHAYADRSPVLLITTSPPLRDAESNVMQSFLDESALARPMSKWTHKVTVAEEIPHLVSYAIRVATSGAPGPVVLDIPIDVLFRPVAPDYINYGGGTRRPAPPAPAPAALSEAIDALRRAERPAIIAGAGVSRSTETSELLTRFADLTGIPVFSQRGQTGVLPHDHPLNGYYASSLASLRQYGTPAPDVVLMLGARFGMMLGGRGGGVVPLDATIIQVDTDGSEIGHVRPFDIGITADCGETLRAFLDSGADVPWPDRSEWAALATTPGRAEPGFADEPDSVNGRMHPYHALRELARSLPADTTIVIDGGEAGSWMAAALPQARSRRAVYGTGYLGFLGVGPGLAIGAAVAEPGRQVVLVVGDGAHGFHLQEFDTMARHELPILTVVVNNAVWGMSIHGQDLVYGKEGRLISELRDTNYEQAAIGLGANGVRARTLDEIAPAVAALTADGGPGCLNLSVSGEVVHPVTPMMVGDTSAQDQIVIPYYDNLPK